MGQVAGRSEQIVEKDGLDRSWQRVRDRLRGEVGPVIFEGCLSDLALDGMKDDRVVLTMQTAFMCDWVRNNYADRLTRLWQIEFPSVVAIDFTIGSATAGETTQARPRVLEIVSNGAAPVQPQNGKDGPLPSTRDLTAPRDIVRAPALDNRAMLSGLDRSFTFANFVAGKSNALAYEAARRVAESHETLYNPLYIHGASGLGKTHLMLAIGNAIVETMPGRRVQFVHAEAFLSKFLGALRAKDTLSFKETYRSVDVLLIDDLHYIVDKQTTLEEMFNTLHALISARKQVVITADRPPAKLEGISERIKSWLGGGMTVDVPPTDYALRLAILKAKMAGHAERQAATGKRVVTLGEGVLEFVAETVTQSVRDLEGALTRIVGQSELLDVAMTLETVRPLFRDALRPERPVSLDDILQAVSQYYEVKISDIKSPRRTQGLVRARHVGMWLARDLTQKSFPQIALRFGGRDHTTVMSAVRKIDRQRKEDPVLQGELDELQARLRR